MIRTTGNNREYRVMENLNLSYVEEFENTASTDGDSLYTVDGSEEGQISESVFYETTDEQFTAPANGNVVNVDNDFGGDIASAIASANEGDTVQLGNNVYYTDGITINKNIVLNGVEGSIIDGTGTGSSILTLTPEASGATIQNMEITNGNNGIYGSGATNITLQNLNINNIGINQTIRHGENNTGIMLNRADGVQILDSNLNNIGRKGVGIGDTSGALVSGVVVENVNLDAQHAQSHDAAGVKFYNTFNATVKDSYFDNINANNIWNDITSGTTIEGNTVAGVGDNFIKPDFNTNVEISGIYNEKSVNSTVTGNTADSLDGFLAYNATAFTTESMALEDNNFSHSGVNTTDYWANKDAEILIATTENAADANFDLYHQDYLAEANIG